MENQSARSSLSPARSSISLSDPLSQRLRRILRACLAIGILLPLAACGFKPLYAERANGTAITTQMSNIDVKGPETRVGRAIKYNLLDRLGSSGGGGAAYRVEFTPSVYQEDVAIQQDADVTRNNVVVVVPFKLVDTATDKTIFKSVSRSRSSYNRVDSEFANIVAARDAEKRTSQAIADDIKQQLGIYFDRRLSEQAARSN
ncbi:MAG: hypothetical protein GC184_00895 [Rhizobiales bacterium]|nr:hypothetical protein [Hyphomicrobiales bacterium]